MRREDVAPVASAVVELAGALRVWETRDDSIAQPHVTVAGNRALEAIDRALRELHRLRGELITEYRRSEDIAAVRVDALLARCRAERRERAERDEQEKRERRAAGGGW
jgi:hypothetical protein